MYSSAKTRGGCSATAVVLTLCGMVKVAVTGARCRPTGISQTQVDVGRSQAGATSFVHRYARGREHERANESPCAVAQRGVVEPTKVARVPTTGVVAPERFERGSGRPQLLKGSDAW